jgi:ketosteroid isomerase-like protein
MHATDPAELPLVFQRYFNARDLDGLTSNYYAEGATYAPLPGVALSGEEVHTSIGRLLALGHEISVEVRHTLVAGDTALIVLDWQIEGAGMRGTATDVARRQPDGSWRCIIDNPHGGAHSVDIPDDTARALAG